MSGQKTYNFSSPEFIERSEFLKNNLGLDVAEYFFDKDGTLEFNRGKLYKDLLSRLVRDYCSANNSFFPEDFSAEEYIDQISENDVKNVPLFVFFRDELYKISEARGDSIKDWMENDLKKLSDGVIKLKDDPDIKQLATTIVRSGFVGLTLVQAGEMECIYGMFEPLAPVALEGALEEEALIDAFICTCSSASVATAVLAGIAVIAVVLVSIACIDRELSGLIINDSNYDIYIEDIYMEHGSLTAMVEPINNERIIKAKKSENMVYASFYTIEKNFGFVGTECTMRLRFRDANNYYYLSANPLSEDSRINLILNDNPEASSESMHGSLYNNGRQDLDIKHRNLNFAVHLNNASGSKAYAVLTIRQEYNDFMDLTQDPPKTTGTLDIYGRPNFRYNADKKCHELSNPGFCNFSAQGSDKDIYTLLLSADNDGAKAIYYDGEDHDFEVEKEPKYYTFSIAEKTPIWLLNTQSKSNISIRNNGESKIYIHNVSVTHCHEINHSEWMKNLDDSTPLENINIPGAHDAAAINKYRKTLYACHNSTITAQLMGGIRMLDIRICVIDNFYTFLFMTCHGSYKIYPHSNEYQSLQSLLDECRDFLDAHPSETLILSLKIDDFQPAESKREEAYNALADLLAAYPIRTYSKSLGNLGSARGKMILFNRINTEERFGYPMFWKNSTEGEEASQSPVSTPLNDEGKRDFVIYVQDMYNIKSFSKDEAMEKKFNLVTKTIKKMGKNDGKVYLNYASACYEFIRGVYIQDLLIKYFGKKENRSERLGWILLDYEFAFFTTDVYGNLDIVSIIIASNFNYDGCSDEFNLL